MEREESGVNGIDREYVEMTLDVIDGVYKREEFDSLKQVRL